MNLRSRIGTALRQLVGPAEPAPAAPAPVPAEDEARSRAGRSAPPPLRARIRTRPGARCVIVVVVGIPADDLETVIERASGDPSTMPVFLTDDDRFEIFRRHGAIFEYLPPIDQAPDLDVDIYRLRRLALFRRKWRPAKIVAFGGAAAELVRTWRASPFEDGQINELTGGPPVEPA